MGGWDIELLEQKVQSALSNLTLATDLSFTCPQASPVSGQSMPGATNSPRAVSKVLIALGRVTVFTEGSRRPGWQ